MLKNRNTRLTFSGVDIVTALCCLAGMAVCLVLFQQDLNMSLTRLNEEPVAVIYFKYNTAQRRLVDRNLWERLKQASPVYNGDRIRTAASSEAVAVFPDGMRLDLHENTLIQLFKTEVQTAVDFVNGSLSATTAAGDESGSSPLHITAAGKTMTFTSGTTAVVVIPADDDAPVSDNAAASEPAAVAVTVMQGDVAVRDAVESDIPVIKTSDASSVITLLRNAVPSVIQQIVSIAPASGAQRPRADTGSNASVTVSATDATAERSTAADVVISAGESAVIANPNAVRSDTAPASKASVVTVLQPAGYAAVLRSGAEISQLPCMWRSEGTETITFEFSYAADFSSIAFTRQFVASRQSGMIQLAADDIHDLLFWRVSEHHEQSGIIGIRPQPQQSVESVIAHVFSKDEYDLTHSASPQSNAVASAEQPVQSDMSAETEPPAANLNAQPETASAATAVATEPAATTVASEPAATAVASEPAATAAVVEVAKPEEPVNLFTSVQPVLTSPKQQRTFTDAYFEEHENITFTWNAVADASKYVFVLEYTQADGTKKALLKKEPKKNRYVLAGDELLSVSESGKYVWSVTAVNKAKEQSAVSQSDFTVQLAALGDVEVDTTNMINSR